MVPNPPDAQRKPPKIALTVQDFTALPLALPANQHPSYHHETTHYLYLRPNAPRIPTEDTARELFLVNVPIDADVKGLRRLFAEGLGGGRVEGVEFEDSAVAGRGRGIKAPVGVGVGAQGGGGKGRKRKRGGGGGVVAGVKGGDVEGEEVGALPEVTEGVRAVRRSGGTAVVRFVDATSAALALKEARRAVKSGRRVVWSSAASSTSTSDGDGDGVTVMGKARYRALHAARYPDHVALQASTDAYMAAFAAREAEEARALARKRAEPDADGFVTVVRGGRNPAARAGVASGASTLGVEGTGGEGVEGAGKRRKKHKGLVEEGFYRFQVRERMKREHGELARRFEEDTRRVEAMRRRRGVVRPE